MVRGLRLLRNLVAVVAALLPSHHDDVSKWKHFPCHWPFVRGIQRSPVNSPHKGQWRGALVFSFICSRINGWVNNGEAGDLRCHRAHYDVTVMTWQISRRYGYSNTMSRAFETLQDLMITRLMRYWTKRLICFHQSALCFWYHDICKPSGEQFLINDASSIKRAAKLCPAG